MDWYTVTGAHWCPRLKKRQGMNTFLLVREGLRLPGTPFAALVRPMRIIRGWPGIAPDAFAFLIPL